MSGLEEFLEIQDDETNYERILQSLMVVDEHNLLAQTEIERPEALIKLWSLARWLQSEGLKQSAQLVDDYILQYLKYMISFDRKSRRELVESFKEIEQAKKSNTEKLLGTD